MCHLSPIVYKVFFLQYMLPLMSILIAKCGNISLLPLGLPAGAAWSQMALKVS